MSFHCQGIFHLLPLILFQPFILTAVAELSNAFSQMQTGANNLNTERNRKTRDHPHPLSTVSRPQQCWARSHKLFSPQKQGLEKKVLSSYSLSICPICLIVNGYFSPTPRFDHRVDTKSSVFREGTLVPFLRHTINY
jgi:hypothetical protein